MYSGSQINFVASFPKAGTHLVAWFLSQLGLEDTNWQIGYDMTLITNINDAKLISEQLPSDILSGKMRRIIIDRNQIMPLIKKRQFAVGHLPPHVLEPGLHFRMKSLLLVRGIRSSLVSYYNYYRLIIPEDPSFSNFSHIEDPTTQMEQFLEAQMPTLVILWRDIMAWKLYRSNLTVTYENLKSEKTQSKTIARIAEHFSLDPPKERIDLILKEYAQSSTPTKLALPEELRPGQWSKRCEELYEGYGCGALDNEIADLIAAGH